MSKKTRATSRQSTLPESVRVSPAPQLDKNGSKKLRFLIDSPTQNHSKALGLWIKACRLTQIGGWAACGVSSFAFGIVILTPILVPLLTFGSCFSGGVAEWKEFTATAIQMSLYPGLFAALTAGIAVGSKRMLENLSQRFEDESKRTQELRTLEDLMKPSAL